MLFVRIRIIIPYIDVPISCIGILHISNIIIHIYYNNIRLYHLL